MPTDQNNGVTPNQNPINNTPVNPNNSWNDGISLNLEGVELDNTSVNDKEEPNNLSDDSLFDVWTTDSAPSNAINDGDNWGDRLIQEDKAVQANEEKAETPAEPVVETPAEPVVETPAEPVVETPAEQVVETPAEPVVETPAEPVVKTPAEPVAETPAEPVVETPAEPVVETPAESVVETPAEPVVETSAEPVVETPAEPVVETPAETATENAIKDEEIPTETLTVESVWNQSKDFVSDTWDSSNNNWYIPSESEFEKMTNLLENSKPGQVDLSWATPAVSQQDVSKTNETNNKWVFNLDYVVSSLQSPENKPQVSVSDVVETPVEQVSQPQTEPAQSTPVVAQNIPVQSQSAPVVEQNIPMQPQSVAVVAQNIPVQPQSAPVVEQNIPVQPQSVPVQPQEIPVQPQNIPMQPQNIQIEMPQQNMQWAWNVQWIPIQNVIAQNTYQQPMQTPYTNIPYTNVGQEPEVKKSKKWLKVFLILLFAVGLLCGGWYILSKMYPDVVASILWENNLVIEYSNNNNVAILGSESDESEDLLWDMQWEDIEWLLTWENEIQDEENNEIWQSEWDDILDPDSLAALLQPDENEGLWEPETKWEEVIQEVHNSADTWEIDTYKDLWLLIDEDKSDENEVLKSLNDYKAKAIIYQERGSQNDNQTIYKYSTYIIKKCTTLIENIETTWKMDINEVNKYFDQFDWYLSKMEELKSNS